MAKYEQSSRGHVYRGLVFSLTTYESDSGWESWEAWAVGIGTLASGSGISTTRADVMARAKAKIDASDDLAAAQAMYVEQNRAYIDAKTLRQYAKLRPKRNPDGAYHNTLYGQRGRLAAYLAGREPSIRVTFGRMERDGEFIVSRSKAEKVYKSFSGADKAARAWVAGGR